MPLTFAEPDALARVYAKSLFELATQEGGQAKAEHIGGELAELVELARTSSGFSEFIASRILPSKARAASLDRILGGNVDGLTLRFLQILNNKDRLAHLPPIAAAFDQLVQTAFGRIEVNVYTAHPATGDELDSVRSRLQAVLGKEPVIHAYTEPAMIGGLKLQIGDQLIDASVASSLRRLRDRFQNQGAAAIRATSDRFLD